MANERDHFTPVMSTAAAIAAAAAWLATRKKVAEGEPGEPGEIVIPEELMVLIAAIAATSDNIYQQLQQLVLDPQFTVKGWPDNTKRIRTIVVTCVQANVAYNCDTLLVHSGMALIVKSSPANAAGSLIRVATNQFEATSPEMSYPLLPNEAVAYHVEDAGNFWVSSTVAGSVAIFSTEQEV